MFLFTNAPVGNRESAAPPGGASRAAASGAVIEAIRDGARSSGVGFDYLLAAAQRESSLDPEAKAASSTATGLFQFIEQTWLGTMKSAGAKLGLAPYADAITARADGSFAVSDPTTRQAILDLRKDPRIATAMAGMLTRRNGEALTEALGREPTAGDLYAAHVLGAKGAAGLIGSAQGSPARAAALDLPEAAAANRNLFYDKSGRARGSAELYALLSTSAAGERAPLPAASAPSATGLPEGVSAYAAFEDGLRGLFQTDRRQGAISAGVAKLWQGRGAPDSARAAPSYFPRSQTVENADDPAAVPEPETTGSIAGPSASSQPILVPLPPRRPAVSTVARAAARPAIAAPSQPRSGS